MESKKKNRLKDYDYSQDSIYFITICTKDRKNLFWIKSVGASIARPTDNYILSDVGIIAEIGIKNMTKYYPVNIDCYVVMPNHIHILIELKNDCGRAMLAPTIPRIIQQYKGYVTKNVGYSLWQKSFYDHIVRSEDEYLKILYYIQTNPLKWSIDKYYTER